jgi:hypothetical protein
VSQTEFTKKAQKEENTKGGAKRPSLSIVSIFAIL